MRIQIFEVPPRPGEDPAEPGEQIELSPSKIVGVGRNYVAHAAELGNAVPVEPVLFLKPPSSLIRSGGAIVFPRPYLHVQHEAELAVVIGRRCRRVRASEAMDHVLGLTCANDVTVRELQDLDVQWTRSKGFDTFCPIGPWIVRGVDPRDLAIRCRVNGEIRQAGRTSEMITSVPELIELISRVMTLEVGDVICTGTPAGVSDIAPGDVVDVEIEGIGTLTNPVIEESGEE